MITRRTFSLSAVFLASLAKLTPPAHAAPAVLRKELIWLSRFVGKWSGAGEGEPGVSTVTRSYEPVLDGNFLMVRNHSVYRPQPKNPKGEVHEDIGFFSFDSDRHVAVLRQFHVEGFVNQYTAPALAGEGAVFTSEVIENYPKDARARESYRFAGANAFEEIFELAEPGKDFAVYSHNHLKRI